MKRKLVTIVLRAAVLLIKALPKFTIPWLATFYSWVMVKLNTRDAKLIASNVERVYRLPPHSVFSRTFQKQVFLSQALIALETFKQQFSARNHIRMHGREELRQDLEKITAKNNGLVLITAHHGSWEMIAGEIARATGKTFVALAKPSKLPEFTELLQSLRSKANTRVLLTDSKNLLRDMMKTLKDNGNLGFVMDQKPEGRVGPIVDFLGQPTEFVTGPAKLAIKHETPVVAIFCIRTGPWEYRIEYETVVGASEAPESEQILTQKMAAAITRSIQLYPEQWIWNYKRWRSKPQASTDPLPNETPA